MFIQTGFMTSRLSRRGVAATAIMNATRTTTNTGDDDYDDYTNATAAPCEYQVVLAITGVVCIPSL